MTPAHSLTVASPIGWVGVPCRGSGEPLDHGCCPYCHKPFDLSENKETEE